MNHAFGKPAYLHSRLFTCGFLSLPPLPPIPPQVPLQSCPRYSSRAIGSTSTSATGDRLPPQSFPIPHSPPASFFSPRRPFRFRFAFNWNLYRNISRIFPLKVVGYVLVVSFPSVFFIVSPTGRIRRPFQSPPLHRSSEPPPPPFPPRPLPRALGTHLLKLREAAGPKVSRPPQYGQASTVAISVPPGINPLG